MPMVLVVVLSALVIMTMLWPLREVWAILLCGDRAIRCLMVVRMCVGSLVL